MGASCADLSRFGISETAFPRWSALQRGMSAKEEKKSVRKDEVSTPGGQRWRESENSWRSQWDSGQRETDALPLAAAQDAGQEPAARPGAGACGHLRLHADLTQTTAPRGICPVRGYAPGSEIPGRDGLGWGWGNSSGSSGWLGCRRRGGVVRLNEQLPHTPHTLPPQLSSLFSRPRARDVHPRGNRLTHFS